MTMIKVLRFFLTSDRNRRRRTVGLALWLLRMVRDAESAEVWRCSDLLDSFEMGSERSSRYKYNALEEEYSNCEASIEFLDSALDDLEFVY